jgi:hypothetical protein
MNLFSDESKRLRGKHMRWLALAAWGGAIALLLCLRAFWPIFNEHSQQRPVACCPPPLLPVDSPTSGFMHIAPNGEPLHLPSNARGVLFVPESDSLGNAGQSPKGMSTKLDQTWFRAWENGHEVSEQLRVERIDPHIWDLLPADKMAHLGMPAAALDSVYRIGLHQGFKAGQNYRFVIIPTVLSRPERAAIEVHIDAEPIATSGKGIALSVLLAKTNDWSPQKSDVRGWLHFPPRAELSDLSVSVDYRFQLPSNYRPYYRSVVAQSWKYLGNNPDPYVARGYPFLRYGTLHHWKGSYDEPENGLETEAFQDTSIAMCTIEDFTPPSALIYGRVAFLEVSDLVYQTAPLTIDFGKLQPNACHIPSWFTRVKRWVFTM